MGWRGFDTPVSRQDWELVPLRLSRRCQPSRLPGPLSASAVTLCLVAAAECPDQSPELQPWSPGHDPNYVAQVGHGTALLLMASATVNSLYITDGGKYLRPAGGHSNSAACCPATGHLRARQVPREGGESPGFTLPAGGWGSWALRQPTLPSPSGKLVVQDRGESIVLRARHILIEHGGELHVGSVHCPFQSHFSIILYGRWVSRGERVLWRTKGPWESEMPDLVWEKEAQRGQSPAWHSSQF